MTDADLDEALTGWLRSGRPDALPRGVPSTRLLHRIDLNGIGPMLARQTDTAHMPPDLAGPLRNRLIGREMWEAQHRLLVRQALEALQAAGLHPLVMKGTALAWTHYSAPALRMRGDSDLLIEPSGRTRALAALTEAGFIRQIDAGGAIRTAETLFRKADMAGGMHDIDLHWALGNSAVIARLFSHEELMADSVPIPALCNAARGMGDVHAIVYTAVHRRKHLADTHFYHLDGATYAMPDNLVWLMDIHLLFGALDATGRAALLETARQRGVAPIVSEALRTTRARLGTAIPETLLQELDAMPDGRIPRYLKTSKAGRFALDLAATPGFRSRVRLLAETVFPEPAYMRVRYSGAHLRWLPWLYIRRGLDFVGRRLRNGGAS